MHTLTICVFSLELLIHIVDKFSYSIVSPFLLFCKNFFHVIRIVVLFLAALQFTLVQSLHIDLFFCHLEIISTYKASLFVLKWLLFSLPGE